MTQDSMQIMLRYNQLWESAESLSKADDVLAEDFVRKGTSGTFRGVPAFKTYALHFMNAFPDGRFSPEDWIQGENQIVVRYRFIGTHIGEFIGIPPSGEVIGADGVAMYKFRAGRLQELWDFLDMLKVVSDRLPFSVQETAGVTV